MQLTIKYIDDYERPWLIKREHGEYEQHAHCFTKKDAEKIRTLIDCNKYPHRKEYRFAVQRLLTAEEFKKLKKKDRYYNVNNGAR